MANVIGHEDLLRRAIHWVAEEHRAVPERSLAQLVSDAGRRFDLSSAQFEWLRAILLRPTLERPAV